MNNQKNNSDTEFIQVSRAVERETNFLINYIQREFNTSKICATFTVSVLIGSLEEMIKLNNGQESVKEIIEEYNHYNQQ